MSQIIAWNDYTVYAVGDTVACVKMSNYAIFKLR